MLPPVTPHAQETKQETSIIGDNRRNGGSFDFQPKPEYQQQIEHNIGEVGDDHHPHRSAGILGAE
ncbi:Uncharacterised protein [Vibrio cholerae]|nr:Uncharacterised protein [Vibrio cholerae]CSB93652.1 Uncharacterised protein [Vibrio cholerae]CSC03825.1 Uncharacterised protein [Vibrio cholerae]CSC40633.1 Uncharacterised protein [Vibrio cholerae]CSC56797.1 Uncharacterised protein [Vibrio cholerae]